ncbi:T9SS type B sorting domain-containing protein [Tenacibaculum sp. AHE15PA]|uniref:T9SS type B sorting domain-containing protein n=1 Tax=unclassified Tenacibaculum TaxID=2635139 RepID=UPI001C4EBADC|nr:MULTISPECIES: T9SS type B sorting domain-containing protein [unclassified Tenacibaculum]QXP74030.1 T9SS type B sorting domain-containing protein [Tenacibaculum sp. AHE14PA]QXP75602.1 T9SS type B sorting domain-containing protein [Tenacibaculum sp. AHE15PA]
MMKKILIVLILFFANITFSQEKLNLFDDSRVSNEFKLEVKKASRIQEISKANKKADTPFTNRLGVGGINVRGNITFVGNNILSIDDSRFNFIGPNDDFNFGGNSNTDFELGYIDIDDDLGIPGNNTTFSSSMSTLNLPSCSRVVYAGLYWASIYPYDEWSDESAAINTRDGDFNTMKFKAPGQPYQDITGTVLYDDGEATQLPYVCYSDVTSIVQSLGTNYNGDYFGANIKATLGQDSVGQRLGSSAGWVLVIIYENEGQSSKNISLFDGFSTIDGVVSTDVTFSGFTTIPSGPVRVQLLTAALEGDKPFVGDSFQILNQSNNYVDITTGNNNQTNNFFNSSITKFNNFVNNRAPRSTNTLGFDVDLFNLSNPSNSVIGNGQSSIDLRFTTAQDAYFPFLNAMTVEIIEPKVQLIKTIEDAAGNDISGASVGLGSELFYNIRFQNVGTDGATNTEIIDVLPKNVDFLPADLILPAELESTRTDILNNYELPSAGNGFRGRLIFEIPDNLVEEGGEFYDIKIKVQVVSDCNQLRDVCTNIIENQAFANYGSDIGGAPRVNGEESFAGLDSCNFGVVGTSNFLVDISGCDFRRTEILCAANLNLIAGSGFDTYLWEDVSSLSTTDQEDINVRGVSMTPGSNQTQIISTAGFYRVIKTTSLGCLTKPEIIEVVSFNDEPNPLAPFASQVLPECNGFELAEIYLCGINSSVDINLPFTGSTTVNWFKLDDVATCTVEAVEGCANIDTDCAWTNIGAELDKNFDTEGEYRLEVLYDGRCPQTYYFNVYKATLNPTITTQDIVCNTPGSIAITNVPDGYEYSLTGPGGFNEPFSTNATFSITDAGDYDLSIRLIGAPAGSCTYTQENINIQSPPIQLNVTQGTLNCSDDVIQITASISGVPGGYSYEITRDGVLAANSGGFIANNSQTFDFNDGGTFVTTITTVDGCTAQETRIINKPPPVTLTATTTKNISCVDGSSDGIITLTPGGGTLLPGLTYNISLISAPASVTTPVAIAGSTYNVANGNEGTYTFQVTDSNNCATTATATVVVEPEVQFTTNTTDISCNGLTDGQIAVSINGADLGYTFEYSIDAGANWTATGVFSNLAANPSYTVRVRASKTGYQCIYDIENIEIQEPAALTGGSTTHTDHSCDANGNTIQGTISFTDPTGGTGVYTFYYKLDTDATYDPATSNPVINLAAGTYNIRVEDANGCPRDLADVVIDPIPGAPTFNQTVVYNCEGEGSITITPFDASYTYTLDGTVVQTGANANVFTEVAVGAHSVRVNYFGNCRTDIPVTVAGGNAFSGDIRATSDSECFGSDNGSITIGASNVIGTSFEYSVDGGTTWSFTADNPYRVVGLAADTYDVFIREVDGGTTCVIDLGDVTITQPDELTLTAAVDQQPTCSGPPTGTIIATASGGVPPYEFSIDDGATWQSSNIFNDVPGRVTDYIVMIRDSRNCNECGCTSNLFENGSFEQPTRATRGFNQRDEDDVPGWDTTDPSNTIEIWYNNFQGVPAKEGVAFAELNSRNPGSLFQEYCTQPGDEINWSVSHRGRSGVDVATVKIGDDLATAGIVETMTDGNSAWGDYSGTYTVPVGQSTTVIAFDAFSTATGSLSVGNFIDDVKITILRNNCVPVNVSIQEPDAVEFTVTPETCYNGNNGTLTVNVTGGNDDYLFSIDNGATWETPDVTTPNQYVFSNLTEGTYNVTVQDGLGCTIPPIAATINAPIDATVATTNQTCNALGQIAITPTGGDGNYQYVVTPIAPTVGSVITSTTSPIDVAAGSYTVSVRDQNGAVGFCEYTEDITITRIADPTIVATETQPDCSGDTGSVSIAISNGTADYTTTITLQGAPGTVQTSGPSSDVSISFNALADGTYDIVTTDANGCSDTAEITIAAPNPLSGTAAQSQDYTCAQLGEITVENVTGGTAPYTYTLSDGTTSTAFTTDTVTFDYTFEDLTDGTYTITITDANSCSLALAPITISPLPTAPTLTSAVTYNCDGTGTITISPFDASYTYTLNTGTPVVQNGANANIFTNVPAGNYTVSVAYGSDCTIDATNIDVLADQEFTAQVTDQSNPVCIDDTNGSIEITAAFPSVAPTSFEYSLDGGTNWNPAATNPFIIPNLEDDTYNILVRPSGATTDCNITLAPVTLSDPSVINVAATVTKLITCDADPTLDGATISIDGVTSGGNGGPYTYELFDDNAGVPGTSVQTSAPFTDIDTAGDYWVIAIDAEGCTSTPVLVNVPDAILVTFTVAPEVCYNATSNNGTLTVTILTGNGNYLYSLDGGTTTQTSNIFTDLTDGTYDVTVTDGFNCAATVTGTVINPQLTATVVTTNETCNDGTINITPSGGDGNYVYALVTSGTTPGSGDFNTTAPTTITAGTWDLYVRDQNGTGTPSCEFTQEITITRIADPTIVATETQPDCSGDTGSVSIAISNGTADYTTTITLQGAPGTVQTSGPSSDVSVSFNGLADGTYDIVTTDANGCSDTAQITIAAPNPLSGDSIESQIYTCTQLGEITVENVTGGTAPYTYTLSDGTTSTAFTTTNDTYTFTDLTDGTYTVTITDVNTCSFTVTPDIIIAPLPTAPTLTSAVTYNCDGTGVITISPFDASYTYTLNTGTPVVQNGANANIFTNVPVGNYTVTVDYGSDCEIDATNIDVLDNQEFRASVTAQTNPVCIGDTNGTIEVTAYFPAPTTLPADFEYSLDGGTNWNPAATNPFTIPNLAEGTHNISVRPDNSSPAACNITLAPVTLSDPSVINVAATVTKQITCDADPTLDGATITITPTTSGGNGGPYTYELFDDNAGAPGVLTQTGAPFTDIDTAGDYWVVAIDAESCRSTPFQVNVPDAILVTFTVTPEVCYNSTSNNGTLTVNILTGNGNYLYSLDGGTTTQTSNIFTDLTDGTYDVTVTDGFECTATVAGTVINPQIDATIATTNEHCNALGQISITPTGGDGNYQYVVTPIAPTAGAVITSTTSPIDVAAGTYTVSVRDQNGAVGFCEYTEDVTITRIADPTIVATETQPDCSGDTGSVSIAITDGTADYTTTITLQGAPGTVQTSGPSSDVSISFSALADGTYDILTTDANGCSDTAEITIAAPNALSGTAAQSQDYTCAQLGEITVENVTGGTAPYTYTLSDGTTATTFTTDTVTFDHIFEDLTDGTYTVTITDANSCSFTVTPNIIIAPLPTAPTLTSAVTYNCDGTGVITISPFDASYTYTLNTGTPVVQNGANANIFTNVPVGNYTVTVDYGSDCEIDATNIDVLDNQEFRASVTAQTNPVCIGDTNGTIEVTAYFPAPTTLPADFEYSLNGGTTWNPAATNPFTIPNLEDVTYNIVVRPTGATTDCNITLAPVTLSDPSVINVAATVTKQITCDADPTLDGATITITPTTSGGNGGPYTYELFDDNAGAPGVLTQTGAPFTDIDTAGDYWVVAIDAESCRSTSVMVTVLPRQTIVFTATPQCYDGANGIIDLDVTNGNGTYEYSLDGTNFTPFAPANATTFSITGLSSIAYTVTIRDIAGCTETANVTINDALVASAIPTDISCVDGQILLNPTGGSGTYVFSAVPDGNAAGAFSATNPIVIAAGAAGTYDVYVQDDAGCEYIIQDVIVNAITPVAITATPNQPTCNGDLGSIDGVITANTGQAPYTITITNSAAVLVETISNFSGSNFSFNNLPAETYTVEITDALGCTDTITPAIELVDPPAIVMDIQDVLPATCVVDPANTGFDFINIDPTDYLPNTLQYSIDNGATWIDFTSTGGEVRNLNSGDVIFPTLRTIDGSGNQLCFVANGRFEVAFNVSGLIVDPVANPGNCAVGFSVTVEALGGGSTSVFEFAINSPSGWVGPDALNNGTMGEADRTYTFTGLTPGLSYEFFVRDTKGTADPADDCIERNNEDLYVDYNPTVPITSVVNSQSCFGLDAGEITFTIDNTSLDLSNNFTWTLYERDPITNVGSTVSAAYTNQPQTGFADITVTGLSEGVYYIILTNNTGTCDFGSQDATINPGTQISADLSVVSNITCSTNGVVRLDNVTGGTAPYTYTVATANNFTIANATVVGNTIEFGYADVTDTTLDVTNITVTITDSNGNSCATTVGPVDLTVSQPPVIIYTEPNSCDANKTITVRVNSGTGPYQFSVDGGTFSSAIALDGGSGYAEFIAQNLTPGNHVITVRDANGCTVDTNADIQPDLEYEVNLTKNLTCDTVTPANEAATYEIDNITGSGSYTYEINGAVSGNVVPAGTALPATPFVFSTAIADEYTITITDTVEGCTNTKVFTVAPAVVPAFTTAVTDATCNGGANGSIAVAVTAGLTPLTYSIVKTDLPALGAGLASWDAASNSFINVPAGTYTVTVTGDNGCSTDEPGILVEDNPLLTVNAPTPVQFGCTTANDVNNATLSINALDGSGVSGGTTVYSTVELYHDVSGNNSVDNLSNTTDDVLVNSLTITGTTYEFSISDVAGGSYYVRIVDSANCEAVSTSTVINAFDPITDIDIDSVKDIDCQDGENIEVKTSTDIAGVDYQITAGPAGYTLPAVQAVAAGTDPATFTDLPTGSYTITATHPVTGCVFTKTYTVGTAPDFTVIANNPQATCFGDNGGSIDISFDASTTYGGVYDYEVLDTSGNSLAIPITGTGISGVTTETITGLLAGTYYVEITMTDTPFCTEPTNQFTINQPTAVISVTGVVNPGVSCTGIADATITATGADGFGGYTYQLEETLTPNVAIVGYDFATNGTNNVFTGLAAGNYTIRVRDVNDCEGTSVNVEVADPIAVSFTAVDTDNACDTNVDGSILVTAAGGTGSYTYVLTNSGGTEIANTGVIATTTHTFNNLTADTYTVSVTDSNGCAQQAPIDVIISEDLIFTLDETKNLTCNAPMAAEVVIEVASGSGTYTYEITGPSATVGSGTAFTSPLTFNPTVVGTYTVTITDTGANPNCSVTRTIDIAEGLVPAFTTAVTDATCNGGANGSIAVAVTAGLTPLTYSIVKTDLPALGAGLASWDAASNSFINVPAGTYTVTVTGDNGCSTDEPGILVEDNPLLTVNAPTPVQFGCTTANDVNNATLSINALDGSGVSGGTTVYSTVELYHDVSGNNSVDNLSNTTDDVLVNSLTITGTTYEFSISDVAGGSYYVRIVDSANCEAVSTSTVINAFDPITDIDIDSVKDIDCQDGENIEVKTSTDIAGVDYQITAGPAGYTLPAVQAVAAGTDPATFTDLPTGSYTITATHPVTGCVFTKTYTVGTAPDFTVIANNPQATCFGDNGGSIDISFDASTTYGGVYDYEVLDTSGNSLAIPITGTGISGVTTETITGLLAGTYYVEITMTDTPFCTEPTNQFTINQPTAVISVTGVVNPGVSCTGIADATITATGADGFGGYTYQLEETLTPNVAIVGYDFATNGTNNVFTGLAAGNYTIRVRDVNDCEGTSVNVEVADPIAVSFTAVDTDNACDTNVDGSILVTAAGGTGSYTYVLTNSGGTEIANTGVIATTTHTFNNLTADTYTVSVTDSNGCAQQAPIDVIISEDLIFTLDETKNLTCNAPMAAEVVIEVASGSGTYTYEITGPSATVGSGTAFTSPLTFNPTVVGTYTVTITDTGANPNCSVTRTIDIAEGLVPAFTTAVTDATCNGGANGSIAVAVTAGLTPLTYSIVKTDLPALGAGLASWDAASNSFINVPAGTYTVTVTGDNGCSTDEPGILVEDNPLLTVNAPTPVQFGCTTANDVNNATLSINALDGSGVSGGTTVYSTVELYHDVSGNNSVDNLSNTTDDVLVNSLTITGTTYEFSISDVAGGSYYVRIVDSANCEAVSTSTVINAFDPITDIDIDSVKDIDCQDGENIEVKTSTDIAGVDYQITAGPAGYTLPAVQAVAAGTDPATFTDLPTGSYTITATHPVTGCVFTKTYTVGTAPDFTVIANNPQATCFGDNGGSIDISFDASTTYGGVYDYEVLDTSGNSLAIPITGTGISGVTTETITGLLAGTYYVEITMTDTPFCTEPTNQFTINQPTAVISVTGVVNPGVSCTGIADATITATGADGFGGYTYQLEETLTPNVAIVGYDFATNGTNNVFTGLAAGNYTIRVRDVNDCEGTSVNVEVADPIAVSFTAVDTDNACDTNVDGSILVTAAGGTGSYTYVLTNSGGTEIANTGVIATTTHTFNNLTADTYTVSVTDSNGCAQQAPIDVIISEDLIFTLDETKNLTCNAPTAAEVVIEVASGSGTYTYEITGPSATVGSGTAFTSPLTFNPTVVGTYTVTITDTGANPSCDVTRTIEIEAATLPSFTASVITDNICNGASNGAIRVTAIDNGISPLTYTILPNVGTFDATTNTFEGLPADTYIITATGANGCTFDVTETVNENPIIDISGAVTVTDFDCAVGTNTTNNATISVDTTGAGGTGDFVRAIFVYDNNTPADTSDDITQDSGVFNFTITNEAGGEVTVTVFDSNNCADSATRTIAPFARITTVTITADRAIDCNEGEDILATYTSTLPIANVEYRLYDNTSNTLLETRAVDGDFVTLLPTGVYRIEVENTDTNCVFTEFYTVNDAPVFDLIIDNIQRACFNGTASVDVSFNPTSPYSGDYTYEVFNVGGVTTGITGAGVGTTATTITGLAAGNYYVTISMIDTPFCSPESNPFEIVQPTVDLTLSEELTYIKCTPTDSGEVSLTAVGGWGVYEYQLEKTGEVSPIQSFSNNAVITGLTAGDYTATVRDANNCIEAITFTLEDGIPITGTFTVTPNVCIDESTATISVDAVGGQLQAGTPLLSYTYILEYPDGTRTASQSSNTFTNLPAGIGYYVLVADGYSCDGRVGPIDIVDPTEVVASADIIEVITCNRAEAVVEVSGTGGTGPYEFSTDGINFIAANATPNHRFDLPAGEHQIYVRDNEACISDAITVRVNPYTDVTATLDVSSAFITCNGDANGVLIANAQDGFGNYEYQLVDENDVEIRTWQSDNSFTGLGVGTYKINVRSTNAAGEVCSTVTGEYTIAEPIALTGTAVATQNVSCFGGSTGIITAQGFEGNGGYEYNIISVPANPLYPADKFVTNGVFENLPAATYYVTIKDVIGCTIVPPIEVVITEPDALQIGLNSVTQQTCLNDPSPIITVDVQGGTQPYFISINNVEIATPYNTGTISLGAAEGIEDDTVYVISVRDSGGGCPSVALPAITTDEAIDLDLTVDWEYTCPVGNIIVAIVADQYKNNMSYTLYDGAGSAVATNTTGEFVDVAAGNGYTVTATNTISNCAQSSSDSIDIEDIQALTMFIDDSQKNKLIANVDFGLPPYNFTVDGVDYGEENEFTILQTKDYTITVTDARGCQVTITIRGVYVTITVLNLFTPDGDGTNDFWYPLEVEPYHNIKVYIFDRYARKIVNYQGVVQGWDGTYEGKPLPAGDYWYTIYFNELSGEEKKLMGHFTLYR